MTNEQNDEFNVILLDFLGDLIEVLAAHSPLTIRDQDDLALVFQLFAVGDDHLNGQDDGRNR